MQSFVLFGATGDLSKRKLIPALYNLYLNGRLPELFQVVGSARTKLNQKEFQEIVQDSIQKFSRKKGEEKELEHFLTFFKYLPIDVGCLEDFHALQNLLKQEEKEEPDSERIFYLAMAPDLFGVVCDHLKKSQLTESSIQKKVIVEKPFGHDFESAKKLNETITKVFEESEIYRIDHYLGKEMVQNIEVMRFANSLFEPLWNNRYIDNVQITSTETVGVEERAGYYETSGALLDMVQNHMLQMLMMVAMEPPSKLTMEAIRDEKVKVLHSLRRFETESEIATHVIRAQYEKGTMQGKDVPGYANEPGVKRLSQTETFVAAKLFVDNFRWAGVPFYIRSGKRMQNKSTKIVIQFKNMPKNLYFNKDGNLQSNLLVFQVNPTEGVFIQLNTKDPEKENAIFPVNLDFVQEASNYPEAYERLILDAMHGDSTFFTRWDEVSLAWKFVDPIKQAFQKNKIGLYSYPSGSMGPKSAEDLLMREGKFWW